MQDEFKRTIEQLKGLDDKIRCVLNKVAGKLAGDVIINTFLIRQTKWGTLHLIKSECGDEHWWTAVRIYCGRMVAAETHNFIPGPE